MSRIEDATTRAFLAWVAAHGCERAILIICADVMDGESAGHRESMRMPSIQSLLCVYATPLAPLDMQLYYFVLINQYSLDASRAAIAPAEFPDTGSFRQIPA